MPPVNIFGLRQKKLEGKDFYSQRDTLETTLLTRELRTAAQLMIRDSDRNVQALAQELTKFADAFFDIARDPDVESNREAIEEASAKLEEFGDFLGKVHPSNPYTNVYSIVQEKLLTLSPASAVLFEDNMEALNTIMEFDLPLADLKKGKLYEPTAQQANERRNRQDAVIKQRNDDAKKQKELEDQKKQRAYERKRQKKLKEQAEKKAKDEEKKLKLEELEKERKRREKEERERLEEENKSDEQKEADRKAAEQKKIQMELSHQALLRKTITEQEAMYRDPACDPEQKMLYMATSAAFLKELNRVGVTGQVPIDTSLVNADIQRFFQGPALALAKAEGSLDELAASSPEDILKKITDAEKSLERDHEPGKEDDPERARSISRQMGSTWRVKKNSKAFNNALKAMQDLGSLDRPATRAEQYAAAEIVKKYVDKNKLEANSTTGANRMGYAMAFLKQTMSPNSFKTYCNSLNAFRRIPFDANTTFDLTHPRAFDPHLIGTLDEIYAETRERIAAASRGKSPEEIEKPAARDLAILTAVANLKQGAGPNGGDKVFEKGQLEKEIAKVQADPRFQRTYANDNADTLINKSWWGNMKSLDDYDKAPMTGNDLGAHL